MTPERVRDGPAWPQIWLAPPFLKARFRFTVKTKDHSTSLHCTILLLVTFFIVGCKPETSTSSSTTNSVAPVKSALNNLDFDALLSELDAAIGKRFQSMQMDGMHSASYQYAGPIKTVVDIVEPMALGAGFTEEKSGPSFGMEDAIKEMQTPGFNMSTDTSINPVLTRHR